MKREKVKGILALLLTLVMVCSMVACGAKETPAEEPATAPEVEAEAEVSEENTGERERLDGSGYTLGMILINADNSIYVQMKDDAQEKCDEYGADFYFVTAPDATTMVSQLESLAESGCDAILYAGAYGEAIVDTLDKLYEQGVNLLCFDGEYENAIKNYQGQNYEVGYNAGKMCGEWILETFGAEEEVPVGLLTYTKAESLLPRDTGMREGLAETAPNAVIVQESEAVLSAGEGMEAVETFLQAEPDLAAVIGFNGTCSVGAYQAFAANGLDDDKHAIFGIDGTTEEYEIIATDCCYVGTSSMGFSVLGGMIVEDAISYLNGYDDGEKNVWWPIDSVTVENVKDFQ